jgi:hypothetical protein
MLRAVDGSAPVADGSAVLADVPSAGFAKGELGEGVNVSAVDAFDIVVHFFSFVGGFSTLRLCGRFQYSIGLDKVKSGES